MTKRTCQFPKHTCLRETNFLKIAGISLLLFCTTSQIAVADSYEKNAVTATQQSKTEKITGKIVDESGEAIIGASVKVQGSTIGTITNMEGEFMIPNVPNKAVLEISYIGYKPLEVAVGKSKDLRITMEEDTKTLDEVIVVGYGTTSKRKTTAAIASVNTEDIIKAPTANITQSLAGRAPGLLVTTSGGGLNNFSSVSIRGGGTPLYVIDDVISEERDFRNLNAEDIDQITILKDAASTAVYGARAANGIVMIVTKQGKAGKMSVNYNFNYNWSQPANMPNKLDAHDAAFYKNMSMTNDGLAPAYTDDELESLADQARKLLDDELLENNPRDQYLSDLKADIEDYHNKSKTIRSSNVCDSNDVVYQTVDGRECAYVTASYFMNENNSFDRTNEMYVLRKDDDGDWKILVFYQVEGDSSDEQ